MFDAHPLFDSLSLSVSHKLGQTEGEEGVETSVPNTVGREVLGADD